MGSTPIATEGAKESPHALTVFAFVKNKTTAHVVSSAPRNISVISRSAGNRNCIEFYDYFNLKISR
jgi:hypothetical protein